MGAKTRTHGHYTATPRIDIKETERAYEVSAELPGIDKKDVELTLDVLTIRGELEARFKNGVPSVRLPKSPEATARTRRIEVKAT